MQIILISDRLAKTKSVTLSSRHLVGTAIAAMMAVCVSTVGLYWLTLRYADARIPGLQRLVLAANESEAQRDRTFVQQNLNAMAVKLGEMQAQLTRLDDEYSIEDLLSRNGIYLNGVKVHSAVLRDGDELQLGDVFITYHEGN